GAAKVSLTVDGKAVATGDVPETVNKRFTLDESFDVGSDQGTAVAPQQYATPNRFGGSLTNLEVKLD
ncbi:MAG: hypothetical protein Q8R82_16060, partial [Hyphomonadaceae bacterium]|nr:hypothetical protein [Hyphomonadaceae bacterium]